MTRGLLARIVATITVPLVVVATCVLSHSAAASATCSSGSAVSVVVDPGALGGSIATICDPGSGEVAATRFEQSGFALTEVQRFPGFVCRVNGAPASDPCVNTPPADAYWSLWWTDGSSGTWSYASQAVTSLDVPDGGAVALVWQQGAERRTPGVAAPVRAAPSPTPTKTPTPTPTTKPTRTATPTPSATSPAPTTSPTSAPATSPTGSSSPTAEPSESTTSSSPPKSPSSSPADSPSASDTAEQSASVTTDPSAATPSDATDPGESRATAEQSSSVPTWLTVTILVLLLIAIGMSTYAARRRTHH